MRAIRITFLGCLAIGLLGGCAHSAVDAHWGEAQDHAVAQQIAHPDAGLEAPKHGIDGDTASGTMETHRKDQARRRAPSGSQSIINIGAGGS